MKVKCKYCTVTIDVPEQTTVPNYVCKKHHDVAMSDPDTLFDVRWKTNHYKEPVGYQVIVIEESVELPDWAKTDSGLRDVINAAFPKWRNNEVQRYRASRWARVLYLGYRVHWTLRQIANEMGMTLTICDHCGFQTSTPLFDELHAIAGCFCSGSTTTQVAHLEIVENIWRRAQRVATGMRADGTGRRRPRKKRRVSHDQYRTRI